MPKTVSKHIDFFHNHDMAQTQRYGISTWKSQKDKHLQNKQNNLLLISAGFEAKHMVCL